MFGALGPNKIIGPGADGVGLRQNHKVAPVQLLLNEVIWDQSHPQPGKGGPQHGGELIYDHGWTAGIRQSV